MQAAANARPPLLVLEPLREFLDANNLGEGAIAAEPIGEGHSNVTYLLTRADGSELVLRFFPHAADLVRVVAVVAVAALCVTRTSGQEMTNPVAAW